MSVLINNLLFLARNEGRLASEVLKKLLILLLIQPNRIYHPSSNTKLEFYQQTTATSDFKCRSRAFATGYQEPAE